MIISYLDISHITEEYELRLQESARNRRFLSRPHESLMRQSLGRLIAGLGDLVHRQGSRTIDEPADVRLATK